MTLANVYFPNSAHISFCNCIIDELKWFASGCLIVGGDFNIPLNPLLDTSSGTSCISYKVLKRIKMFTPFPFTSWHPESPTSEGQIFYFLLTPHTHYSQTDYIFISQKDIPNLRDAKIGIQPCLCFWIGKSVEQDHVLGEWIPLWLLTLRFISQ